ncbi:MAG: FGGY family carbohydrate kinase, partial [Acidimicrobiales bacterium]
MSILVVDVGTSGVRSAVVRTDATVVAEHHRETLPDSPAGGLVEFDADVLADVAIELATRALAEAGPVEAVGIATQRASTIVWDRATGRPVGPALGWQDLRTIGECLVMGAEGLRLAPNQSATKVAWLLDTYDPDRALDLCFGTPDTWIAWKLSGGELHVTDLSNAAVTGLVDLDGCDWDDRVLEKLRIPRSMLPTIVDSTSVLGPATALPGAPPIAGILGDQQASMLG